MAEVRKLAAILCSDVVGYSRLAGADEDRIIARLRAVRSDLIDPTIAVHNGRVVKRTGDGSIVEFRSVVDAVRCAIEVQNAMVERNAGVPEDRRIVFRIGNDIVDAKDAKNVRLHAERVAWLQSGFFTRTNRVQPRFPWPCRKDRPRKRWGWRDGRWIRPS
jgi:hypothetical protein